MRICTNGGWMVDPIIRIYIFDEILVSFRVRNSNRMFRWLMPISLTGLAIVKRRRKDSKIQNTLDSLDLDSRFWRASTITSNLNQTNKTRQTFGRRSIISIPYRLFFVRLQSLVQYLQHLLKRSSIDCCLISKIIISQILISGNDLNLIFKLIWFQVESNRSELQRVCRLCSWTEKERVFFFWQVLFRKLLSV